MKEDDLVKKSEIATQISENVQSHVSELIRGGKMLYYWEEKCSFRNILRMNLLFRLFEEGTYLNYAICREFNYSSPDESYSRILSYNGNPVKHPLMYGAGVYIASIKKAQKPSMRSSNKVKEISEKILLAGLPKHNYLSWAFFNASLDTELLSFILEKVAPRWD